MFLSMPNQRMKPTDKPDVMFKEAAAGAPPAVQVWFYPAERHRIRVRLSARSGAEDRQGDAPAGPRADRQRIARIDENDRPVSADADLKESSEPRQPVATPAPAASAIGTSGATPAPAPMTSAPDAPRPARKHLPRTSSTLPLLALLSGASFAGAFGVRAARRSM